MSLVLNKPYPIKIAYLRNDPTPASDEDDEKVSLTLLSSFIQKEKNYMKNRIVNSDDNSFITSLNRSRKDPTPEQVERAAHLDEKLEKIKANAARNYNKWKLKKSKTNQANYEEKKLLTNLIGPDWADEQEAQIQFNELLKRNTNAITVNEKVDTKENEHKKKNKKLLQGHFKTFLSERKHHPANLSSGRETCVVTKMDERANRSLTASFIAQFKGVEPRSMSASSNNRSTQAERERTNTVSKNYSLNLRTTIINRHAFKGIPNFQWSKLSNSQKFRLNDHS